METTGVAGTPAGRGIQPLDSLYRHARLVVLVFALVVAVGLPAAFIKGQPSYQTTGTIQVSPRYMKTLRDDIELEFQSNTQFLQFIHQQARTINRYDILELALQRLDQSGQGYWHSDEPNQRKRIERLQQSLAIRHVRDTYLVQITLTADAPEGLAEVVNAVIESYLAKAREEQVFAADERVFSLRQREADLLLQVETMTGERSEIGQALGVTAFDPAEVNPFDRQVRQLQTELLEARQRRIVAEARLDAFLDQGETDTEMRSIQESILSDPGLNSLKASLNQRRAMLMSATSGMAEKHPARLDAEDELSAIEQEIGGREQGLRSQLAEGIERRHRTSVAQARAIETRLEETLAELDTRAGHYAGLFNRAVSLNHHLELVWSELDRVRDRLNFFAAEEAAPGFSRLVTVALPPLYPTGAGKKRLLAMLLAAALALAIATPMIIDFLDPRIRTVADAHRALGFAPTGWLVEADTPERKHFVDNQLRRLASSLIRESARNGTRILVLTSVRPGGGSTWLTRQLAGTLNQLGFPTLATEANAYGSKDGFGQGPGLAQWLSGALDQPPIESINGIPILRSGLSSDEHSLGALQRLPGLLRSLPASYRFIIIDAPPILTHADAELIAAAGDAVLLIAEAGATQRGEMQRAGRLLQSIDPPVVGSLVNRISPFLGGGYIDNLIEEHRLGQKAPPRSKLHAIGLTALALARAPFELVLDLGRALGRHSGKPGPGQQAS